MSTIKHLTFQTVCDKCNIKTGVLPTRKESREKARSLGYRLGKKRDLCQACRNEVDQAIAALRAGES